MRKEICTYPPIKIKWKKSLLDSLGLSPYNDTKVVWQCKQGKHYEQILLREFMTYRLYNLISPYSYRVQLVQMDITDEKSPHKNYQKYGFFLEDDAQLQARLKGTFSEDPSKKPSAIMREEALRFYVFQYMVGNTDWSLGNLHNVRLLEFSEIPKSVIIPYDFDYAGLVSAAYAIPHETIPIKDVRERYYKGGRCTDQEIELVNKFFLEQKPLILEYCEGFPYLDEASKKDVLSYIGSFFAILEHKNGLHQVIGELKPHKE